MEYNLNGERLRLRPLAQQSSTVRQKDLEPEEGSAIDYLEVRAPYNWLQSCSCNRLIRPPTRLSQLLVSFEARRVSSLLVLSSVCTLVCGIQRGRSIMEADLATRHALLLLVLPVWQSCETSLSFRPCIVNSTGLLEPITPY